MLRPDCMLSALNTVYLIYFTISASVLRFLSSSLCTVKNVYSIWFWIHYNHKSSRIWFELDSYAKKKPLFLRGLCSLSWVPVSVQVWTLSLCVYVGWSASRRCRAADHMQDLKQPNRLVITANHSEGFIVKEAYRWLSVCLTGRSQDCLAPHQPLFHCNPPLPQQNGQDHLDMFWQYFLFIAGEIRSSGKQNTQICCLWVKLVNVNYVAWGAAVWLSIEK